MATVVLGNHDLHLIALAFGNRSRAGTGNWPMCSRPRTAEELVDWLRHRPLAHYRPETQHADGPCRRAAPVGPAADRSGWPGKWSGHCAARHCAEYIGISTVSKPSRWSPDLTGQDRLRFITNCLTRMRYCEADGTLDLREKGPPGSQPAGLRPWFELAGPARPPRCAWSSATGPRSGCCSGRICSASTPAASGAGSSPPSGWTAPRRPSACRARPGGHRA